MRRQQIGYEDNRFLAHRYLRQLLTDGVSVYRQCFQSLFICVAFFHKIQFVPLGNGLNVIGQKTGLLASVWVGCPFHVLLGHMVGSLWKSVPKRSRIITVGRAAAVIEMQ